MTRLLEERRLIKAKLSWEAVSKELSGAEYALHHCIELHQRKKTATLLRTRFFLVERINKHAEPLPKRL
jgi:hypothetical protein